jgi:hypothetical protein
MRSVYVPLRADMKDALLTLAEREDRDPRRQAARLVQEGLERAGVLPITTTDHHEVGKTAAGLEPANAGAAT